MTSSLTRAGLAATIVALASGLAPIAALAAADSLRQAEVAERGKDVMPFTLSATTHVFTKSPEGGVQRVVAKQAGDDAQVRLVRQHLQEIRGQFLKGDFSGPSHIHGTDMPGLATLRQASPGQIGIDYQVVTGGAELIYRTDNVQLVNALHQWFDAQVSDHGADAKEGHMHHGQHPGASHDQ
jgi:hypothetical protein